MGKSLIIKGADFSAVAVGQVTPIRPTSFVGALGITDEEFNTLGAISAIGNKYGYAEVLTTYNNQLLGKTIYGIRIKAGASGNIPVHIGYFASDATKPPTASIVSAGTIEVKAEDVGNIVDYLFDQPIFVGAGIRVYFGLTGLTAGWYYGNEVSRINYGFTISADTGAHWSVSSGYSLGIDYLVAPSE